MINRPAPPSPGGAKLGIATRKGGIAAGLASGPGVQLRCNPASFNPPARCGAKRPTPASVVLGRSENDPRAFT